MYTTALLHKLTREVKALHLNPFSLKLPAIQYGGDITTALQLLDNSTYQLKDDTKYDDPQLVKSITENTENKPTAFSDCLTGFPQLKLLKRYAVIIHQQIDYLMENDKDFQQSASNMHFRNFKNQLSDLAKSILHSTITTKYQYESTKKSFLLYDQNINTKKSILGLSAYKIFTRPRLVDEMLKLYDALALRAEKCSKGSILEEAKSFDLPSAQEIVNHLNSIIPNPNETKIITITETDKVTYHVYDTPVSKYIQDRVKKVHDFIRCFEKITHNQKFDLMELRRYAYVMMTAFNFKSAFTAQIKRIPNLHEYFDYIKIIAEQILLATISQDYKEFAQRNNKILQLIQGLTDLTRHVKFSNLPVAFKELLIKYQHFCAYAEKCQ